MSVNGSADSHSFCFLAHSSSYFLQLPFSCIFSPILADFILQFAQKKKTKENNEKAFSLKINETAPLLCFSHVLLLRMYLYSQLKFNH